MARTRKVPGQPPDLVLERPYFRAEHRRFVMVSRPIFEDFHRRWAEIDRTYPTLGVDVEHWDAVTGLRESARKSLRAEVARDAQFAAGSYLIPL